MHAQIREQTSRKNQNQTRITTEKTTHKNSKKQQKVEWDKTGWVQHLSDSSLPKKEKKVGAVKPWSLVIAEHTLLPEGKICTEMYNSCTELQSCLG